MTVNDGEPLERFPLGTPACTSATTVPTRNYTKPQSKHFSAMFTLQHTSLTIEEKKKEEVTEKRKDLGETGSGRRSGTLENKKRGSSW